MADNMLLRLGAVLRQKREERGLTQRQLSETTGYSSANLSRFESGQQRPSDDVLKKIADALGTTISALYVRAESDHGGNVAPAPDIIEWVPLIGDVSAGSFQNVRELEPWEIEQWFPAFSPMNGKGFALRINGNSMTCDGPRSYPDGCVAVFKADEKSPESGNLVLARLSEAADETTFKKFVKDAGRAWLEPLNPRYPIITDHFDVVATFKYALVK